MAKSSQLAISYSATGDGMTLAFTSSIQANASSPGEHQPVTLATGDNTITVPTGAKGVVIVPPSSPVSTVVKKLKGAGGDTGFTIRASDASFLSLPDSTATIIINASAGETVSLYWL